MSAHGPSRSHEFDSIRKALSDKIAICTTPDDVEKLSSALKSVTEAATSAETLDIQRRNIDMERLKSWSTIVVPLVSVLGLTVTIWTQAEQLTANRYTAEDNQWISTLTALTSVNNSSQAGIAYIERIKPFLTNSRYADVAKDIATLILSKMADYEIFQDLFHSVFAKPTVSDIPHLARISRGLNQNWDAGKAILDKWNAEPPASARAPNQPAPSYTMPRRVQGQALASEKDNLEHAQTETYKEIVSNNALLADLLRKRTSEEPLDLGEAWFPLTDLHNANLTNVDFNYSTLDRVNLDGADLHGIHFTDLSGIRWWLAKYVGKDAIESLVKTSYPYSFNEADGSQVEYATDEPVTLKEYQTNVERLCKQAGCKIPVSQLKIGPLKSAHATDTPSEKPSAQ